MTEPKHLLSLHYLPSIQWFSKFSQGALIEQHENFSKRNYRNRCRILGANGAVDLSIPLLKGKNSQMPIRDVEISNHENWRRSHWQSIQSAYGKSPFFEFYAEDFERVYQDESIVRLFDFNVRMLETILEIIPLQAETTFTEAYIKQPGQIEDWRRGISPRKAEQIQDPDFVARPYQQVFADKHGFVANLSIIDLIFCKGPESELYL